ncbi:MAG: hypothetical protein JRN67_03530 [Nitrososphaerota archaeon]|nr:hypothetical protein [Nitrososphaerota archaeon]
MSTSKGYEFLISSLNGARRRLADLEHTDGISSANEIWETYCDIEQAIEVSKYIFGLDDRLGNPRSLRASQKNNPALLPRDDLIQSYRIADAAISSAIQRFQRGNGEDGIECSRKARDVLKTLLVGIRKSERGKRTQGSTFPPRRSRFSV